MSPVARAFLLLALLIGLVAPTVAAALPALFAVPSTTTSPDHKLPRDAQVVRAREVVINTALLTASADAPAGFLPGGEGVLFNLFDELAVVIVPTRIERFERGVIWVGQFRDNPLGQAILVISGDIVSGNITAPGARYHIRYAGNGRHETQEIDESRFPSDEPRTPIPAETADQAPQPKATKADDGSTIDVMVVYTATARAAAGGTTAMRNLIDLGVAETNQSYMNSGIAQRLRLVHSEEVSYAESGDIGTDLDCITNTSDGCIDQVHTLRNTYGADLVSLWVENGGGYCGIAWLMTSVSASFAPNGFSVVARSCATGYYSFGHEMGHNMGARHDTYVDSGTTPYTYAHGYTRPAAMSPWRTVMAYNNACTAASTSCTRIQYWSNPAVSYGGTPMGDASSDNHQTLNNTAYTVANFRATAATVPGAPTIGTATAGNASASVAFAAPASNGGAAIDNYRATCTPGSISATGSASPINVAGLSNGTTYTCTVAAHNSVGWGAESGASNSVVPQASTVQRAYVAANTGNDTNTVGNCSAAAPCRTFSSAMSVIATGGEVVAMESGNYGTVSITRSLALIGAPGQYVSIVASSGGSAVNVSGVGTRAILRNLSIVGTGATHGILMTSGDTLSAEHVLISGFPSGSGIDVSTAAKVQITDALVRDNYTGVRLINGVAATIIRSRILGNTNNGVLVAGSAASTVTRANLSQVIVTGSGTDWGISAQSTVSTATVNVQVTRSVISRSDIGLASSSTAGGTATLTVNRTRVSGNNTGLYQNGGGAVLRSRGNNTFINNTANTTGTISALPAS